MTGSETECPSCPLRYFTQRTISADGILTAEKCAKCPANKKVSSRGDTCIPCLKTDDICECEVLSLLNLSYLLFVKFTKLKYFLSHFNTN